MSSWDAVTMENPASPVYRVMDKGPRTRSMLREDAAIRIQKHFRGMIVRNPTGIPLKKWYALEEKYLNISDQIQEMTEILAEEPKNIYSRWLDDPIVPQEEKQQCHLVGWSQKNHYSILGFGQ